MSEGSYQIKNGCVHCPCCNRQICISELLSQLFDEGSLLIECAGCGATIDYGADMTFEVVDYGE